jgi:hypothetical protein
MISDRLGAGVVAFGASDVGLSALSPKPDIEATGLTVVGKTAVQITARSKTHPDMRELRR